MSAEWVRLCRDDDLRVEEPYIYVDSSDNRRHRVRVDDDGEAYLISAFVVRRAEAAKQPGLAVRAWLRNRVTTLVGFRIDSRRQLVAEAWVPKAGLTSDEFHLYVRTVAAESDRFEYVLTGSDAE